MRQRVFTILSAIFLFLTFFAYKGFFQDFFMSLSVYTPLIFACLGLVSALFGLPGYMKAIFVTLHSLSLLLFITIIVLAFGFQQP
ncbi:MAG: hypothetical protein ABS951_05955 [Solibacillus sp.]